MDLGDYTDGEGKVGVIHFNVPTAPTMPRSYKGAGNVDESIAIARTQAKKFLAKENCSGYSAQAV